MNYACFMGYFSSASVGEASDAPESESGLEQSIPAATTPVNARYHAPVLGRHHLHPTTTATTTAANTPKRIVFPDQQGVPSRIIIIK